VSVLFVKVWLSDVPTIVPLGACCPSSKSAFKLLTAVVEATTIGAVPVASVEVIWLDALTLVNAPVDAEFAPIGVPSTDPPSMFTLEPRSTVPEAYRFENFLLDVPSDMPPFVAGWMTVEVMLISSAPPILMSI
jgi:hypothetical protein